MGEKVRVTFPALELRVPDSEERIVEGIVVPWNETTFLSPHREGERFAPGSLTRTVTERGSSIKLFRGHDYDRAIGTATRWNPTHETGLWGQFRIARTSAGDDVLTELREGMLDAFSVGFRAIRTRRASDGAREVLEARLHETSIAPIGAYDGARVLEVRTEQLVTLPPMPEVNLEPIPPLRPWI